MIRSRTIWMLLVALVSFTFFVFISSLILSGPFGGYFTYLDKLVVFLVQVELVFIIAVLIKLNSSMQEMEENIGG